MDSRSTSVMSVCSFCLGSDVVRGERAAHDAIVLLRRSEELLGQQRRLLEQDRGKLRDALEEAKNQNSVAHQAILKKRQETVRWIEQLADEANGWMAGLLERLRERSFPEFEQLSQEQLQKNVPFFFSQVVRDGMAACFDAHQDAILARVEDCSVQSARSLVGGITDGTEVSGAVDHATFHTPAWTFFDHLHVVGALLGGITGLIAPLLAGLADRGLAEEQRAAHYRAAVRNAFPNLERQVKEGVLRAYQELAARVDHQLAGELEMEQERLQATLSGALAVHDRGAERVHEAARTLMEVAEAVAATRVLLEDLRSRLRGVEGSHGL